MKLARACWIALLLPSALCAEFKANVYGYAKLDIQYNDRNTGSFPSPSPLSTPLNSDKADAHGELIIDGRESRIGVKALDTFKKVDMTGLIEGDFFTGSGDALNSNSRTFRLRHAYMQGDLASGFYILAGQFWSLLMNSEVAQPNLVDFNGPVGSIFAREPQLRLGYKQPLGKGDLLAQVDVEKHSFNTLGFVNPSSDVDTAQGSGQRLPLFVAKLSWLLKKFQLELAGCAAQSTVTFAEGGQTKQGVWGIESATQYTRGKLTLYGAIHHLDGLSRLDGGNYLDAVLSAGGDFHPVRSNGWYAGAVWQFTKSTSLNTVYGWELAKKIPHSAFSGTTYGHFNSFHINVLHLFWRRWQAGLEFQRFDVQAFNSQRGHVDMLHFGLWYYF